MPPDTNPEDMTTLEVGELLVPQLLIPGSYYICKKLSNAIYGIGKRGRAGMRDRDSVTSKNFHSVE